MEGSDVKLRTRVDRLRTGTCETLWFRKRR